MPLRKRLVGGPPSIPQLVTVPSGPFTSSQSQEWGLTSSTLVTVPCKLIGLWSSNAAAKAWCAFKGAAARSRPTAMAPPTIVLVILICVLSFLLSSSTLQLELFDVIAAAHLLSFFFFREDRSAA